MYYYSRCLFASNMDRLKGLIVMMCVIQTAGAGNPEIRKLKTKVDFFLDSIMDVTQSMREIRDDVTSLEERLNATVGCDPAQCATSPEIEPGTGNQPDVVTTTLSGNIKARMAVIQEAFRDEKVALREKGQQQDESIAAIAKIVDDVKANLTEDITLIKNEVPDAIADMSSTFNKTWKSVAKGCVDVSNELQSVKQTLSNDMQQHEAELTGQIKALNTMIDFLLPSVGLARHGTSVYKVHDDLLSWADAQAKCQDEGFHLAETNDAEEFEFVRMLGEKTPYWAGGSDQAEEGVFVWASNGEEVDLTLFRASEPNNAGNNEHCMHHYGTEMKGYNDLACDRTHKFMCEKELV